MTHATQGPVPEGHRLGSPAYRRISVALFLAGLATFASLYSTQPLLPLLAQHFGVSPAQSAYTVSFATVGLGAALLVAGPLSEVLGRTPLMHVSLFASGIVGVACAFADDWTLLLALRALEGVVLAGLPAVAMAYVSEEVHSEDMARAAGLYVGGTALGGMTGRLVAGFLADLGGWHVALGGVGVLALACAVGVRLVLPPSRRFTPAPRGPAQVWRATAALARDPALWCLFGIGFAAMGAFVGVYNAMGFRLEAAPYHLSVGVAGLVFLAYGFGSFSATYAGRFAARWGRRPVEPVTVLVMAAGLALTLAGQLWLVVAGLCVLTIGFFAAHAVASGWVAARSTLTAGAPGQASSTYLFAYYLGSSVCGAAAGQAWSAGGWGGVGALTGALLAVTLVLALILTRIPSRYENAPARDDTSGH